MDRKERLRKKEQDRKHKEQTRVESVRKSLPLLDEKHAVRNRSCGECQECCFVIGIHVTEENEKPNYTRCEHQCEKGCAIYHTRPEECKTYYCLWLLGGIPEEEHRPDKLGLLVDFRADAMGQQCVVFWETRPGAFEEHKALVLRIRDYLRVKNPRVKVSWNEYGFNFKKSDYIRRPLL